MKYKPFILWNVIPGKKYLAFRPDRAGIEDIVTVDCDPDTTGWRRGHVRVWTRKCNGTDFTINFLTGKTGSVNVEYTHDDYRYRITKYSTYQLYEIPDNWVEEKLASEQRVIDELMEKQLLWKRLLD